MSDKIFIKVMQVVIDKLNMLDDKRQFNAAIENIKMAHTVNNLKTPLPSQLDYDHLSYRCAYLFRHFTCIAVSTRRMWHRFYSTRIEILFWVNSIWDRGSVNVCSIGGGPATDLLGFFLFLKFNRLSRIKIGGVILEKNLQWKDIFLPLATLFSKYNNMSSVKYKFFDFFDTPDKTIIRAIREADVVSIVKFISAVGYERNSSQKGIEVLLRYVRKGVPVFFLDNSGGGYMSLMENAAHKANLQLIAKIEHQKMRVPLGEKMEMDRWDGYFVYNPQKTPSVSAAIWIR